MELFFSTYSKLWTRSIAHHSGHTPPRNRKSVLPMLSHTIRGFSKLSGSIYYYQ